jgi:predicted transcriptional regulator
VYAREVRQEALRLIALGWSQNRVSTELGVSRAAVREWQQRGIDPL